MSKLIVLLLLPFSIFAGNNDFKDLLAILPTSKVSTPVYFSNPLEPLIYLGYNNIQPNTYMPFQGMVPFGIGGRKSLYKKRNFEIGFSTVAHGQLGYRKENNQNLQGTRVSLLNTDFLLNFFYTHKIRRQWKIKIETFHRSTHLGDDLVLLNGITTSDFWSTDESSYEEVNLLLNRSLLVNTFKKFSNKKLMYDKFPKISYADAMLKYGSDEPDLRNSLVINDITKVFTREDLGLPLGSFVFCCFLNNKTLFHSNFFPLNLR